ncbi:uncharacterized protein LOC113339560 [Papaver somniferum]|uniref:uncharacterized protein LOC113339560 n=1 Tax=Papaver somniferum TaxID=3469 RepID=UPI000E6FD982|nr:uncharacterized protein LOC113339560 [Papaver somniferum]
MFVASFYTRLSKEILAFLERNRGDGDSRNTAMLNTYILENELIDQPLIGGAFTRSKNQVNLLLCRLDRFLFSHDYEEAFPNALQVVLTRTISDHNPILVITEPVMPSKPYFKVDRVWIEHKDFVQKVKLWWESLTYSGSASTRFFLKLQNLKHLIEARKKLEFGHISRNKNELTARIHELNILEETVTLLHTQLEERTLCKLKLRNIEAKKWNLRSKQNDFRWGDSNTRYFHSMASAKKKRNTITKLQVGGEDCFDLQIIKEEIRSSYINLFTQRDEVNSSMENLHFPKITEEERLWLEREFTKEKVWEVIKKMGCNKAPGRMVLLLNFSRVVGVL